MDKEIDLKGGAGRGGPRGGGAAGGGQRSDADMATELTVLILMNMHFQ